MSNIHAQLILQSLAYVEENLQDRRQIEAWYDELIPKDWRMPPRDVVWVYDVRIPGMTLKQQDLIVKTLNEKGIAARHGFKPMSSQLEYNMCKSDKRPEATRASREIIYLPVHPHLSSDDVRSICNSLIDTREWSLIR